MVINALFTHASCCLLLWLGLIKRDIAKEALFAHCDRRKRSYFVLKDFSSFFFEVLQVLWAPRIHLKMLSEMGSCIKNKPTTVAVVHLPVGQGNSVDLETAPRFKD